MASTTLKDISTMPIEQIIKLTNEDFLELVREAKEALAEAKSQKDWIDGIIAIKNLVDHNNIDQNNNNHNFGEQNE